MPTPKYLAWRLQCRLEQQVNRISSSTLQSFQQTGADAVGPVISIVMPVYEPPRRWLERAVASVQAQVYPRWELCIADDASPSPWVAEYLDALANRDERIKVVLRPENGHISAASNSALELAKGDFVALLDNDDELSPLALLHVAHHLLDRPGDVLIYSDEDKIDERGWRYGAYRKGGWNEDLLRSHNFVSHLGTYRRSVVQALGGFRVGLEGSQDLDLALRIAKASPQGVGHIPYVLYHWRNIPTSAASAKNAKPYTNMAALKAIDDDLAGSGVTEVRAQHEFRGYRVVPRPTPIPTVSHILRPASLRQAAEESAALEGEGNVFFFAADAHQLPSPEQLQVLGDHLGRSGVGAVGGVVVDNRGKILDGALWVGAGKSGEPEVISAWAGLSPTHGGPDSRAELAQTATALSFNFMAMRLRTLRLLSGFDSQQFPTCADVDLCLRMRTLGLRCLWLPEISLSASVAPRRRDTAELRLLGIRHPGLRSRDTSLHPSSRGKGSYGAKRFDDALGVTSAWTALARLRDA